MKTLPREWRLRLRGGKAPGLKTRATAEFMGQLPIFHSHSDAAHERLLGFENDGMV
jgi:hypothetical protein